MSTRIKASSCLLEPPAAVQVAPDLLRLAVDAVEALPVGRTKRDREASRRQLDERAHVLARAVDWTAFQWFVVEGARLALSRHDAGLHVTPPSGKHDKSRSIPAAVRRSVAERDGWSCRYCGIRLVSSELLTRLERKLPAALPLWPASMGPQVLTVHPMQLALRLTWDHVEPWWSGGASDETNVVASCGACNFNKKDCSLDELALTDPRDRPPASGWDGLYGRLGATRI